MADFNALQAIINAYIKRNGVQAITGQILNGVLTGMVNALGKGYTVAGAASPTTDPGTMTGPLAYIAYTAGTYTHFDNIVVEQGEVSMLIYNEAEWHKEVLFSLAAQATVDANVGTPAVGVSFVDGVLTFDFRNMKGNPGQDGDPAGFGTISASISGGVGTPGVSVQSSGPDTAKNIAFQFTNLKGETGVTSCVVTVDNTTGNPSCAVSLVGQELHLDFSGLKGAQGNTGSSVDYPFTIVNNLTTDDATQALSAAMGVQLESEVSQLEAKVDDIATGKFYGYHPAEADLPEGDVPGYAYVGTESPYAIYNFDGTTWTDSGATVKRGEGQIIYLEDFPGYDETLSPTDMRLFLQGAIDYVAEKKAMLVFPKGKTFIVDIPQVSPSDPWYDSYRAHLDGGAALWIRGNMSVDFNFCTIKITPNAYRKYYIIYVPILAYNVRVKNGNIIGDRDQHTISQAGSTDEHNYGILIASQNNVVFDNVNMSNVRGDGYFVEGYIKFNHIDAPNLNSFTRGTITNGVVTEDASANNLISALFLISRFKHTTYNKNLLPYIYGYPTSDGYYTQEFPNKVTATFYGEEDIFISDQIVNYGEVVTIPETAISIRISFSWKDVTPFVGQTNYLLYLMDFSNNENIVIRNSEVFDCGRNGITPVTGTPNGRILIERCYVHDCFGTNNEICIDVEGTPFLCGWVHIKNCKFKNPGYGGVNLTTSWHNIVEGCEFVSCGIYGRALDNHIIGCSNATSITLNPIAQVAVNSWEMKLPKSSISDSTIDKDSSTGLFVFNGVVERCTYRSSYYSGTYNADNYPMSVKDCRIEDSEDNLGCYITSGIYERCEIKTLTVIATRASSPVVLNNCKIIGTFESPSVAVSMYGCKVYATTSYGSYKFSAVGGEFVGNEFYNMKGGVADRALCVYPKDAVLIRGNKFFKGLSDWGYSVIMILQSITNNFVCRIEGNVINTTKQLNDGGLANLSACGDKGTYFISHNIVIDHYVGIDIKLPSNPSNMRVYRGINIDVKTSKLTVTTSPVIYEQDASWTPTATP